MAPDGILDVMHITAQGVMAGANMVLVDFHPAPAKALVDGPQALLLKELPYFLEDVQIAREAYLKRVALQQRYAIIFKEVIPTKKIISIPAGNPLLHQIPKELVDKIIFFFEQNNI